MGFTKICLILLALTLVTATASGFYSTQNCSKIMNQRFFDYAKFQKLESQCYDKIKEVPNIGHNS
jgi:hypothetical protein